jgi:hypothetical protein
MATTTPPSKQPRKKATSDLQAVAEELDKRWSRMRYVSKSKCQVSITLTPVIETEGWGRPVNKMHLAIIGTEVAADGSAVKGRKPLITQGTFSSEAEAIEGLIEVLRLAFLSEEVTK